MYVRLTVCSCMRRFHSLDTNGVNPGTAPPPSDPTKRTSPLSFFLQHNILANTFKGQNDDKRDDRYLNGKFSLPSPLLSSLRSRTARANGRYRAPSPWSSTHHTPPKPVRTSRRSPVAATTIIPRSTA